MAVCERNVVVLCECGFAIERGLRGRVLGCEIAEKNGFVS